ncbi:MAG: hypothetical protein QOH39_2952 [Verrucomicrobiota bacterium]
MNRDSLIVKRIIAVFGPGTDLQIGGWHNRLYIWILGTLAFARIRDLLLSAAGRFQTKDRFAVLHNVEAIARNCLKVGDIGLEQIHLARLASQQFLLIARLRQQIVDLGAASLQFFVRRDKQADDDQPDGNDEQNTKDLI